MAPALLAIAFLLAPVSNADAKIDPRMPERTLVTIVTSPFETAIVWHESEAVIVDGSADLVARVEDSYVSLARTPIRLRDGFSRRAVETVHSRF